MKDTHNEPIPVLTEFCNGFDAVTGQMSSQVIAPTYSLGHQFVAAYLPNQTVYDVPDTMTVSQNIIHSTDVGTTFYDSYDHYASQEHAAGVIIHNGTAVHVETDVIKDKLKSGNYFLSYNKIEWTLFTARAIAPVLMGLKYLDADFKSAVADLPDLIKTKDDQDQYNAIVQKYGSDILVGGQFGYGVHMDIFVNKSYVSEVGRQNVSNNVDALYHYIFFDISPGQYKNRSSIKIDEQFKNNTQVDIFFIGGDPKLQKIDTVDQWIKTAMYYPALVEDMHTGTLDSLLMGKGKSGIAATVAYYIQNKKYPDHPLSMRR